MSIPGKLPLVSIIIPVFNRIDLISETLDSILAQDYLNWECIIVDDGSTDGTFELIQKYTEKDNRFRLYKRPDDRQKGANACRNYGFEVSQGDVINWFDSDDLMHCEMLSKKVRKLIENPDLDFVDCKLIAFEGDISNVVIKERWLKYKSKGALLDHLDGYHRFITPGLMFQRNFLSGKKLFNETLSRSQEWEFFVRLFILDPKFVVIPDELVYCRLHSGNITNSFNRAETILLKSNARHIAYLEIRNHELFRLKHKLHLLNQQFKFYALTIKYSYPKVKSLIWKNLCEYYHNKFVLTMLLYVYYLKELLLLILRRTANVRKYFH